LLCYTFLSALTSIKSPKVQEEGLPQKM